MHHPCPDHCVHAHLGSRNPHPCPPRRRHRHRRSPVRVQVVLNLHDVDGLDDESLQRGEVLDNLLLAKTRASKVLSKRRSKRDVQRPLHMDSTCGLSGRQFGCGNILDSRMSAASVLEADICTNSVRWTTKERLASSQSEGASPKGPLDPAYRRGSLRVAPPPQSPPSVCLALPYRSLASAGRSCWPLHLARWTPSLARAHAAAVGPISTILRCPLPRHPVPPPGSGC